jgi:hypothetical protein
MGPTKYVSCFHLKTETQTTSETLFLFNQKYIMEDVRYILLFHYAASSKVSGSIPDEIIAFSIYLILPVAL